VQRSSRFVPIHVLVLPEPQILSPCLSFPHFQNHPSITSSFTNRCYSNSPAHDRYDFTTLTNILCLRITAFTTLLLFIGTIDPSIRIFLRTRNSLHRVSFISFSERPIAQQGHCLFPLLQNLLLNFFVITTCIHLFLDSTFGVFRDYNGYW
jgi:hypothetical protein